MSWVLALAPRRGDGKAWTDDEAATVNELQMRAWRPCDLRRRRGFLFPAWLTRGLCHPRYWPFISMLNSAYRAGTPGVLWSYREMCTWLGMSLRQTHRWIERLTALGIVSVVGTCVAASSEGRRRDDGMNLYMLGPAIFDAVRSAPLEGMGRDEQEEAINLKAGSRARRIANEERDERLALLNEEHYGRGAAVGRAPSFSSVLAPSGRATPAGPKPKPGPKRATPPGGSDKKTPQRPSRSAGNPQKKLRLDNTSAVSHSARTEEKEGARPTAAPRLFSPPTDAFAKMETASARWLKSFSDEKPREFRVKESPKPTESNPALRPAQMKSENRREPGNWREMAEKMKSEAKPHPKATCQTCDGRGWGKNGLGWDASRPCRDCRRPPST